jgi:hypothetical protein
MKCRAITARGARCTNHARAPLGAIGGNQLCYTHAEALSNPLRRQFTMVPFSLADLARASSGLETLSSVVPLCADQSESSTERARLRPARPQ